MHTNAQVELFRLMMLMGGLEGYETDGTAEVPEHGGKAAPRAQSQLLLSAALQTCTICRP